MPDLNKLLGTVQGQSDETRDSLERLLVSYETLYREASAVYRAESAGGDVEGLEDFHRLLQVVRRNRDVVGSLFRGIRGLRPIGGFRFVEEDIPEKKEEPEIDEEQLNAMLTTPETPTEGGANG